MINNSENQQSESIRRYPVIGSRRFSNYWWAFVILFGASGFLLTGLSIKLKIALIQLHFFLQNNILYI